MTLEELEIVIKADISDVTNKLNQLKAQLQGKVQQNVQKAVSQVKPELESLKTSVSSTTSVASKQMEILNRQIDIQAQKVKKLKQAYAEEMKYAQAYAKKGTANWALPDVETAKTKYQQAEIQLEKMQLRASNLRDKFNQVGSESQKAGKKIKESFNNSNKSIKNTEHHTSKLIQTFKRMIRVMLVRTVINSAREGMQDLAVANAEFNQSMSSMQSAMLQARNAITTAFAPALEALAPVIVKVAEAVSWLFTEIAMWGSAFAGKSTYVRAKKVTTDYALSLGKANKEQQKANAEQKKMLAGFDELNVLMEKTNSGLSSGTGLPTAQEMFEEVAIPEDVIQRATAIKEKLQELLPILTAIGATIAGYKLGELFGLWGKGKEKVDNLTKAFQGKNQALGDQQGEYAKEYSWLKDLIPKFVSSAISVTALSGALGDLKDNPIQMPSLQPVTDTQVAFDNAKDTITKAMEDAKTATQTNIEEATVALNEAVPIIDNAVTTAGDTITNELTNVDKTTTDKTKSVKKTLWDLMTDVGVEIGKSITRDKLQISNGFGDMEDDADSLSVNIQKSFTTFIEKTSKNIGTWITNVIKPAIALMSAFNLTSGETVYDTTKVKEAVKNVTSGINGIGQAIINPASIGKTVAKNVSEFVQSKSDFIQELKRDSPELFPDAGKILSTIGGGIAVGSGLAGAYSLTTGDTSWLEQLFGNLAFGMASGGVVSKPTLALVGESASSTPEIVTPQKLLYETSTQANIPVMNAVEELGDKLVSAFNSIGVYAEFDYSKLKVGLDNENYRVGGKLYGV